MQASKKLNVLIVDDEENMRSSLKAILDEEGYGTQTAAGGDEALSLLAGQPVDAVIADVRMPGMDGIQLLEKVTQDYPGTHCLVVTAYGTVEGAVDAMRKGAYDYITKPFNPDEILLTLGKLADYIKLVSENKRLRQELDEFTGFNEIVGKSRPMLDVLGIVKTVAPETATVLIQGESGTGKELVARALHRQSPRRDQPFVSVNCAAVPEGLLESELFGHVKGAFTGAVGTRKGKFEIASSGVIYLDEVADMSLSLQAKILRVIQEREFERVGANETIKVDVRIVAATNRDLEAAAAQGHFREDLYYRLNVVKIVIPPLRDRQQDIPLLAHHFLKKHSPAHGKTIRGFAPDSMKVLCRHTWPGNVRELENAVERAAILCQGEIILPDDLPPEVRAPAHDIQQQPKRSLKEMEKELIKAVLDETSWNLAKAADLLEISRTTLYSKLQKHNISKPPFSG